MEMGLKWLKGRRRQGWIIFLMAAVVSPPLQVSSSRLVCQLTGRGKAEILGQDSALLLPFDRKVLLYFGDTNLKDGRMIPNSMAETVDRDASDCLNLSYFTDSQGVAKEPLKKEGKEASVWLSAVFTIGKEVYAFYYTVAPGWPQPPATYGTGLAHSTNGGNSFQRTSLLFSPESRFSEVVYALPQLPYLYLLLRTAREGFGSIYLARVKAEKILSPSSYEVWDGEKWTPEIEKATALFDNAGAPSIQWNSYLKKWLAVYTATFSEQGFLSQIEGRTADELTGPWSSPVVLHRCPREPPRQWGSCYNAQHNAVFNKKNGQVIYITASDWLPYNVFLYEITLK